jgi:16S rRNA (cytosine967-C5)-methyltransferase
MNSREVALEVLTQVRSNDAYANLLLPHTIEKARLSGRDAGLATELTYGTLRWQGLYDAIAAHCSSRPWAEVDSDLVDVVRLGAHQLLNMRVPPHAAIDTSCNLVSGPKVRVGFVNALLRCISKHTLSQWIDELDMDTATRWSHPSWVVRAYTSALGERSNELAALLEANNAPAKPALVARPGRASVDELRALPGVLPARWSPIGGILQDGTPTAIAAVRAGDIAVQDEGSQLMALVLTRIPVAGTEHAWLDMCAGPGGKTGILAGIAEQAGASLTAVDIHRHRGILVEAAAPSATVLTADALTEPWGDTRFDRVLLDAPCTGIGALRRRPDSRWRRTPADLAQLGPLQRDLLRAAIKAARPGGIVGYVTCSPHLAETVDVVEDVLRSSPGVEVVDAPRYLPEVPDCAVGRFIQLWPHRHGTDAMFGAFLRVPTE